MILLLCRDDDDAVRYLTEVHTAGQHQVVAVHRVADLQPGLIEPGARIHRTESAPCGQQLISALQRIALRVPLVDPTGLLGPIDRREGARSVEPERTPPTGAALAAERAKLRRGFKTELGSVR